MRRRKSSSNLSNDAEVRSRSKPIKKKQIRNGHDSDEDDGSEICKQVNTMSISNTDTYMGGMFKSSVNSIRPSNLYIPTAEDSERWTNCTLEPYSPMYETIPRHHDNIIDTSSISLGGSRVAFYVDSLYDGTVSRMKSPSPLFIMNQQTTNNDTTSTSELAHCPPLSFYSSFEGGNLFQACRCGMYEYDLVLRADVHTMGYSQWFYFSVTLPSQPINSTIRFNIVNLTKPESLYNEGLRPLLFDCGNREQGWRRTGNGIRYNKNMYSRVVDNKSCKGGSGDTFMTLSFSVDFPSSGGTFLLAHSYPYTYTDVRRHIDTIMNDDSKSGYITRSTLCMTLGKRQCDVLTITDHKSSGIE